jgi:hypothetical protein
MTRLNLLLFLALCAQVHAQSGKLIVAEAPKAATVEGYEQGHCVALRNRFRVCKVLSESDALFLIEKEGKTLGTWRANTYVGETQDFKVMRADLDGDRKPELIVANRDSTSVGIGISVWSIAIFPDTDFRTFEPPLTFSVKEFGTYGNFVSTGRRLNILTTDWFSGVDPKGKRGEGLYLVGQWWRYQRGALLPLPRSIMARRYLLSFERERWNTIESDRIPYQWLSNGHTESVSTDFITRTSNNSSRGSIDSVALKDDNSPYRIVQIMLKPEGGGEASAFIYPNEDDNGPYVDRYLGDAASGRIYPSRYLPSDFKAWLNGRRATLRIYADRKMEILWLEPQRIPRSVR